MGPAAPSTFEAFYVASRDRCFRALSVTVDNLDEADDLLAEAYTRALAQWSTLEAHPAPEAWIVRTALNLHRDRWRRSRRARRRLASLQEVSYRDDTDPSLVAAIQTLPTRQREAVALRVILGLSADQTADLLGIEVGTVGTHLRRGLSTLRRTLPETSTTRSPNDTELDARS